MESLNNVSTTGHSELLGTARQLDKHWNVGLVVACIFISLLGAFTSTQLICQAKTSAHISGVFVWTFLSSLTFGFTAIWSPHQVAMFACELDLPIRLDVPLAILSAIIAVVFTFAALGSDLIWRKYKRRLHKARSRRRKKAPWQSLSRRQSGNDGTDEEDALLLSSGTDTYRSRQRAPDLLRISSSSPGPKVNGDPVPIPNGQISSLVEPSALRVDPLLAMSAYKQSHSPLEIGPQPQKLPAEGDVLEIPAEDDDDEATVDGSNSNQGSSTTSSRRSSDFTNYSSSLLGLGNILSISAYSHKRAQAANTFAAAWKAAYTGMTVRNLLEGFVWSLAITFMHFIGLLSLRIPDGYIILNPWLVLLSAAICWITLTTACIMMSQMESHLNQQLLFSVIATASVLALHFTGMRAASFFSYRPPSDVRGYPSTLAATVAGIAIATCLAASLLMAHAATVSRNKLVEIVQTRRKLWMAIAQKENAEAATAARSDFIASASHEIRTPLHQLQGYSDLLARTELSHEGRLLLVAIQDATKTLSLITSNVLDWSRLERNGEVVSRPVPVDMRTVVETIINLLPNRDENADVELIVTVNPEVPHSLMLDETYIHRILMNLLSNALKFTTSGFVWLSVDIRERTLVAAVSDTGPGVPTSFLPQMFEPFKQAQTRGAHRGTGLGLSIVKQLLDKMGGTIQVESQHHDSDDVIDQKTGSTFTVTIPVLTDSNSVMPSLLLDDTGPRIAIFCNNSDRKVEAIRNAWGKFNSDVCFVQQWSDITQPVDYIWADISFLKNNAAICKQLMQQKQYYVLVPTDGEIDLTDVTGSRPAPFVIPISKPLIWHSMLQQISAAKQSVSSRAVPNRMVRFASKVDVLDGVDTSKITKAKCDPANTQTVLLVEDNKINQKLGAKMLKALGYEVVLADDGQDGINKLIEHDDAIQMILMDQSMPVKDGLTATREIRDMEQQGRLSSKRRPIIAVTAVVSSQSQSLCLSAGCNDFLEKPLSLSRLAECLRKHLGS